MKFENLMMLGLAITAFFYSGKLLLLHTFLSFVSSLFMFFMGFYVFMPLIFADYNDIKKGETS